MLKDPLYIPLPVFERNSYILIQISILIYSVHRLYVSSKNIDNFSFELRFVSLLDFTLAQDGAESQWFLLSLWISFIPKLVVYLIISAFTRSYACPKHFKYIRIIGSIWIINELVGYGFIVDIFLMTSVFLVFSWIVNGNICSIWILGVVSLYVSEKFMESSLISFWTNLHKSFDYYMLLYAAHFFLILKVLSAALSLHKIMNQKQSNKNLTMKNENISLEVIIDISEYALYPYTLFLGPIILFTHWDSYWNSPIYNTVPNLRLQGLHFLSMIYRILRLIIWYILWSVILCFIFPNSFVASFDHSIIESYSLSNNTKHLYRKEIPIDRGTIGGSVYLSAIHLFIVYLQIYGWPEVFHDCELLIKNLLNYLLIKLKCQSIQFDDSNKFVTSFIPKPPSCISYFILFSECWRTFDRGLHNFIKYHVYIPLISCKMNRFTNQPTLRWMLAITTSFSFVLLFHGIKLQNLLWLSINVILLLCERFVKWIYYHTNLGIELQKQLSARWIRRSCLLLCGINGIIASIVGFHFYIGWNSGHQLYVWFMSDPTLRLMSVIFFYCFVNTVAEIRTKLSSKPSFKI